jgi:hypothetical protein
MRRKVTAITLALAIMSMFMLSPMAATTAQAQGGTTTPLLTVPLNITQGALTFVGNLNVTRFVNQGGQLVAVGNVVGTLTNTTTGAVTAIVQTFRQVVSIIGTPQAACDILHLEIGPIDLNLLGLVVHVDRIVIDIDAQPGPGNLLGNLLCAIAGLLDGPGPLGAIANLLNQLLGQL